MDEGCSSGSEMRRSTPLLNHAFSDSLNQKKAPIKPMATEVFTGPVHDLTRPTDATYMQARDLVRPYPCLKRLFG